MVEHSPKILASEEKANTTITTTNTTTTTISLYKECSRMAQNTQLLWRSTIMADNGHDDNDDLHNDDDNDNHCKV